MQSTGWTAYLWRGLSHPAMIEHIGKIVSPLSVNFQCRCEEEHPSLHCLLPIAPFNWTELDRVGPKTSTDTGFVMTKSQRAVGFPGSRMTRSILCRLVGSTLLKIPVTSTLADKPQLRAISARVMFVRLPSSLHFCMWTPRRSTSLPQAHVLWITSCRWGIRSRFRNTVRNSCAGIVRASVFGMAPNLAPASLLFPLW